MKQSTEIMRGTFGLRLNPEMVTFSTRLTVQPSPLNKSSGKMQDGNLHNLNEAL